jgi:hypothetical protein
MGGSYGLNDGDVARTMRRVVVRVEEYLGLAPRLRESGWPDGQPC